MSLEPTLSLVGLTDAHHIFTIYYVYLMMMSGGVEWVRGIQSVLSGF